MGFFSRLFGLEQEPEPQDVLSSDPVPTPAPATTWQVVSKDNLQANAANARAGRYHESLDGLMHLFGESTFLRDEATYAGLAVAGPAPGYAEVDGWVERDVNNAEFPEACLVRLGEDLVIGALPRHAASALVLTEGEHVPVLVQVFTSEVDGKTRVDAWIWGGDLEPRWKYSEFNRPPVTTGQRGAEEHRARVQMVAEALQGDDPYRAEEFLAGMVDGVHYLELIEPIKQLKRLGELDGALKLAYQAIQGAEQASEGREPAPWFTLQAAIMHHKLKQYDKEVAVLQRWVDATPTKYLDGSSKVEQRLAKIVEEHTEH